MPTSERFIIDHALPDDLPANPVEVLEAWLAEAAEKAVQPNPNAMTLATVDEQGRPDARIVLCKGIDVDAGTVTFYTNRTSRKGRELGATPRAALVFFWDTLDRQVRVEGPVTHASDAESDAYFQSRHWQSRLGASASDQSQPIESREALLEKVMMKAMELGIDLDNPEKAEIPRPEHWGGYRVWAERVELWISGPGRVHDRAAWTRTLAPDGDAWTGGAWSSTRLQP
ncbi:MAG: pyridoxamine 5'-phosphate oxidase [Phycisphaerales bacterium]